MRGRRRGGAPGRRGHRRGTPGPQGWKRREGSFPGASGGSPTGFGLLPPAPQHVPRVCICRVSPQKPMPRDASPDLCPRPACCGFGEGGGEHAGVVSTRVSTWGQLRGRGAGAGGHVHPEQSSSRGVTAAPPARSEATAPADTPPGAGRPMLWGAGAPSTTAVRRSGRARSRPGPQWNEVGPRGVGDRSSAASGAQPGCTHLYLVLVWRGVP